MRTLYIDIYFIINFSVDVISLYFAALFAAVPTTVKRITLSAGIGALFACGIVFLSDKVVLKLLLTLVSLIIMGFLSSGKISTLRRAKFISSFIIFEALVGGIVTFIWSFLDSYFYASFESAAGGTVNRKMLIFALVVLFSIGVFKMLVSFFSNTKCAGSVMLEIRFLDKSVRTEAFVDSGNLAIDPMDMRPVLLLKSEIAGKLLPDNVIHLKDPDSIDRDVRRRIRLIPISRGGTTHVLTGVRADSVKVIGDNGSYEEVGVTLAVDKEGGSFGGYDALMPAAALENVV